MPSWPPFSEADVAGGNRWSHVLGRHVATLGYDVKGANHRTVRALVAVRCEHPDRPLRSELIARRRSSKARAIPLEQALIEHSSYPRGSLKERLFAVRAEAACVRDVRSGRTVGGSPNVAGARPHQRHLRMTTASRTCGSSVLTAPRRSRLIAVRNLPRERTCPGCRKPFAPRHIRHRYCSQKCWGTVLGDRLRGVAQPSRREGVQTLVRTADAGRSDDELPGDRAQVRGV